LGLALAQSGWEEGWDDCAEAGFAAHADAATNRKTNHGMFRAKRRELEGM